MKEAVTLTLSDRDVEVWEIISTFSLWALCKLPDPPMEGEEPVKVAFTISILREADEDSATFDLLGENSETAIPWRCLKIIDDS